MQFIILLLLFSTSLFAKGSHCDFDSDFAEKYMEARSNYATHLLQRRSNESPSEYAYGSKRARLNGGNWQETSFKNKVKELFGSQEIEIKIQNNGKMLIHPKNIKNGEPAILFDPSGDYFRITPSRVSSNGNVTQSQIFLDINGKPLPKPSKEVQGSWNKFFQETHFKAKP